MKLPDFADIEAAAARLAAHAVRTPLLREPRLDHAAGRRILVKPECLQRTGTFKFRGAWNAIADIDVGASPGGVVAYSSGNHAQGVAAAARLRGLAALIVMPADTPQIKIDNTRALGADIVTYDRATQSREAIAAAICAERRAVLIPPYDDARVIAGQGTVGLELAADAAAMGTALDDVLVCTGGGGLTAGVALALERLSPATRLWAVEPEGFDDHRRSLNSGQRERNAGSSGSICDALLAPSPGEMTFAINRPRLSGAIAVSEAEVKHAMRFAFAVLKLVVEPGGAVALAAVLAGKLPPGGTAAVIISGGNVDAVLFSAILTEGAAPQ